MDFKRGDTFSMAGTVTAVVNAVTMTDFTGWGGRAQLRGTDNGELVDELVFTWLDDSVGSMKVVSSTATTAWPVGSLSMDIEFDDGSGFIVSTSTTNIAVVEDITRD